MTVTGAASAYDRGKLDSAGFNKASLKPFDIPQLLAIVSGLVAWLSR